MSPKNKIKLNLIRKKLDKLDNQLLKMIKTRTLLVKTTSFPSLNKEDLDLRFSI